MPQSLKELAERRNQLVADNRKLLDQADADSRTLSAEEQQEYDRRDAEIDALDAQIQEQTSHETRRQRQASREQEAARPLPRQVRPGQPGSRPAADDGACLSIPWRGGQLQLSREDSLREGDDYRRAWHTYLMYGSPGEQLGLQAGKGDQGGYLAPPSFVARLIQMLDSQVFIRQLATILPPLTSSLSLGVPSFDTDVGDADWTAEIPASDISEDETARFGRRELSPNLLTKLVKMSLKMLRARSVVDVENFMAQRLSYKLGVPQEKAFLSGSGASQPLGAFTASANGISTSRDVTCTSQTAFTADEILDVVYNLKEPYRDRATWVISRDFIKRARKLKDGNGQYLWTPGLGNVQPALLADRPYRISEFCPSTFTSGLYVAVLGDWSFYWIVDSLAVDIQRLMELFSLRNQVGLLARAEVDGMPVLEEAFSRMKLA